VRLILLAGMAWLAASVPPLTAQQADFDLKEWDVEWGGRTRDPAVAPDGKVWFVGQAGNYIANLDPATGAIKTYPTGEATDPHTMVFDGKGHIWFTSQGANRVGRLNMATGKVDVVTPYEQPSNPYGLVLDAKGHPWVALLRVGMVATIDPATLTVTRFTQANEKSRSRRIEVTADGTVWTGDEANGLLVRINPQTKETKQWQVPGGAGARPYALTKDDRGRLWISETGPEKRLVGFDPKTEQFFANIPVSGTIRHMFFDPATKMLWFGTDANKIGRINTAGKPTS
jgi:virginiamycin B lyase